MIWMSQSVLELELMGQIMSRIMSIRELQLIWRLDEVETRLS